MMYSKLEPLVSMKEVARARSSPGIQTARLHQATARSRALAEETKQKIQQFELSLKKRPHLPSIGSSQSSSTVADKTVMVRFSLWGFIVVPLISPQHTKTSEDYLDTLHKSVAESIHARTDRDKRRRKVLIDQMKALYKQEVREGRGTRGE